MQLAFSSRIRIYHAWQNADGNVKRVKQQHESNRAQGKLTPEQLSRSLATVAEVSLQSYPAQRRTNRIVSGGTSRIGCQTRIRPCLPFGQIRGSSL